MGLTLDEIRRIRIETTTSGADTAAAQLQKLAAAQDGVAVTASTVSKETLSAEGALNRLRMSTDTAYRSMIKMAEAQKVINLGYQQGLLGATGSAAALAEQNRLLELAATKYSAAGRESKGFFSGFGEGVKGVASGFGLFAFIDEVTKIPSRIIGVVNSIADIGHVADVVGVTTTQLQLLDRAGAEFGISADTMNSALEKFSKGLGDAQRRTGDLYQILKANHVAISGNLTTDFENYTRLIAGAANAEQKNYLVTAAFGKSAADLGPAFMEAADGIGRAAENSAQLGGTISEDKIHEVERMRTAYADLASTLGTMFESAAIDVVAAFAKMTAAATEFLSKLPHENTTTPAGPLTSWARNLVHQWTGTATPANDNLHDVNLGNLPAKSPATPTIIPDPAAIAAQAALQKQFDAAMVSADKETQSIRAQAATINMSAGAAAAFTLQQKLMDQATQDHVALTPKVKASIEAEAKAYGDATAQLEKMRAQQEATSFFAQTLFDAVTGAKSLSDAFKQLANSIAQAVEQALLLGTGPLAGLFGTTSNSGGLLGSLFGSLLGIGGGTSTGLLGHNANGNAFSTSGNVIPFARGGIVDHPTLFKFAAGTGLMGEAGPEAIMPLKRGANGQLGVQMVPANNNSRGGVTIGNVAVYAQSGDDTDALAEAAGKLVENKIKDAFNNYDKALPDKVAVINRNPRRRGTAALPALMTGTGR